MLDAYAARAPGVLRALARMKALAEAMADALLVGDLDALGMLVDEHWRHQRAPRLDRPHHRHARRRRPPQPGA